ncbi:MAG: EAL domain-containing protein [Actinomycetota bacterium]|nr:EAL domain-containing protein [Actinomycetota bacterium]
MHPSDERVPASYGVVADPVLLSRSRLSAQAESRLMALAVAAAHEYGLVAVAEWVERVEQLETLADLGCDQLQGFLLGRPAVDAHPGSAARRPHLRAVLPGVRRSSDGLAGHA